MQKYAFLLLMFCISGLSFATMSADDYILNPKALQKDLLSCPAVKPSKVTCEELRKIGERVDTLAYELRMNPQAYGQGILKLQEEIARQALEPSQVDTLSKNKIELKQRLAIIKWLESPES